MVYPPCPCCTERAEYCSHHALKLEILHLFAALHLDKSDDRGWDQPSSSHSSALAKCSPNLVEALQSVLAEVRAVAQMLLEQFLSGLCGSQFVSTFVPIPEPSYNVSCRIIVDLPTFSALQENFVGFSLIKILTTPAFRFYRS